jgi:Pretoxin HINT domain
MGMQSFSISSATSNASNNASTQPSTTTSSNQTQSFSSQINLEAPSSVLPPTLTPLSASSITAPSSLQIVTPNAGEVSSIVAPGSGVPVIGTTPASGSSSIVPPSGSVSDPTSGVIPPGGSSSAVQPPAGSGSGSSAVQPLYWMNVNGNCRWIGDSNIEAALDPKNDNCKPSKKDLEERDAWLKENVHRLDGHLKLQEAVASMLINEAKNTAEAKVGGKAGEQVEVYRAYIVENFTPQQQVLMALALNVWMRTMDATNIRTRLNQTTPILRQYVQGMRAVRKFEADSASGPFPFGYDQRRNRLIEQSGGAARAMDAFMYGVGIEDAFESRYAANGAATLDTGFWGMFDFIGVFGLVKHLLTAGLSGFMRAGGLTRLFRNGRAPAQLARTQLNQRLANCTVGNSFSADTKVWVARKATDPTVQSDAKQQMGGSAGVLSAMKSSAKTAVTTMAISSIALGTSVLAFNEATMKEDLQPVTATISHGKKDQTVVTLTLETSEKTREVIETTREHPFAVRVGEDGRVAWVNAIDLKAGQSLARADGKSGRLIKLSVTTRDIKMYNLEVKDASTYYVGNSQWLVHNCKKIALGYSSTQADPRALDNFAQATNAQKVEEFIGWQNPYYPEGFTDLINNSDSVVFNLDGYAGGQMDYAQMVAQGSRVEASGFDGFFDRGAGTVTSWEVYEISQHPEWWAKITCFAGGIETACPWGR